METAFAERLVRAGAETAMPFFRSGLSYKQKSGPHDLVTAADIAAQEVMRQLIECEYPSDGITGEEDLDTEGQRRWLIDPIDGTLAFARGLSGWSIAACLMEADKVLVSVVFDPLGEELYAASADTSAVLNGIPVQSSQSTLESGVIRVWQDRSLHSVPGFTDSMQNLSKAAAAVLTTTSGSLALAHVAAGRLDGWAEYYPAGKDKSWDWNPGSLIVRAAGGHTLIQGRWRVAAGSKQLAESIMAQLKIDQQSAS